MNILKQIRWVLMIEIVLTQLAIAVVLELFKKDKPLYSGMTNRRLNKRRIINAESHN